ncbi:bstEII [Candidatus Thiomargarita nelsonii]|uniref:BstEII n=1 Tax=Candidatus Thiomargarita nelsonii TaxID=1003181 RepID=A0A4E0R225_9GAMM|nr:bstEII [Candidatus Thiomargarita nelsonii]
MKKTSKFREYKDDAANWITLVTGEFYPDILVDACNLYKPVLELFGQLLKSSESSSRLFMQTAEITQPWMRIQLARVFRKYVSPSTPVEMLKKKTKAQWICDEFGKGFRPIVEVQKAFVSRPMPDEALCAILWEYKDRGQKGYDLTERMFELLRNRFPEFDISGPERAGRDILLGEIFENYTKHDRPADFIIKNGDEILAVGFARYDSDRGGAQEDDRTGAYSHAAREILEYSSKKNMNTKVIFVNDGPGLLLGSMWDDYSYLEESSDNVMVVTLRMIVERITKEWLVK